LKPFSDACEENKQPILNIIKGYFLATDNVLEIGSGTGQHAVYFAEHLPETIWHCSDVPIYHPGIQEWLAEYSGSNIKGPYELDVSQAHWSITQVAGMFSANTTHIMSWTNVQQLFKGVGSILASKGHFCLYGPFNYNGQYTSSSNANFDRYLKQRDPLSGIRDFNELQKLAIQANLSFIHDHEMPVNNRILVWQKD